MFRRRCWNTTRHYLKKFHTGASEAELIGYTNESQFYSLKHPSTQNAVVLRDVHLDKSECSPLLELNVSDTDFCLDRSGNDIDLDNGGQDQYISA